MSLVIQRRIHRLDRTGIGPRPAQRQRRGIRCTDRAPDRVGPQQTEGASRITDGQSADIP